MTDRIGLALPSGGNTTPEEQLELVQYAESLGYDSVWVGEAWGWEVFTRLAWLACNTSIIRLGAGIANVYTRTPALLAQTVATLDHLSGGRVLLGLGASGEAVVTRWHGVPFQRSLQRLREYTDIIRLALSGERVNYHGEIFQLQGFRLGVSPLRPTVPIYLASITPAGIRLAGEIADGWLPIWMGPDYLARMLREIRAVAGRSLDVAAELHAGVSSDPAVRDLARAHLARYIGGMGVYYHRLVAAQGFTKEADAIQQAYATFQRDEAARLVSDEMIDALTLAGTATWCHARLAEYRKGGVTLPVLNFLDGLTPQDIRATLAALAPPLPSKACEGTPP